MPHESMREEKGCTDQLHNDAVALCIGCVLYKKNVRKPFMQLLLHMVRWNNRLKDVNNVSTIYPTTKMRVKIPSDNTDQVERTASRAQVKEEQDLA